MKVEQEGKGFQKVTLILESQIELDWLYALSNTSLTQARQLAEGLGITLVNDNCKAQMALYHALSALYKD
jgi:hypothetical protein